MIKKILVPTDFSECAGVAENAALDIGQGEHSEIHFIHGMASGFDWNLLSQEKRKNYPELMSKIAIAEEKLKEGAAKAASMGLKADTSMIFIEGHKSMAANLLNINCDMIVMGSIGDSGPSKYGIGANTAKVLRSSQVPILVMQKPFKSPLSFKTIVFASAFEPDTHKAFESLLAFSKNMGAEDLHLLEVTTPHNFRPSHIVRQKMEMFVAKHDLKTIWLHNYNHYSVEAGVIEFAQRVGADLVAIANHGRSDLSSLFIESIPENLVKYSEFPVISIRV